MSAHFHQLVALAGEFAREDFVGGQILIEGVVEREGNVEPGGGGEDFEDAEELVVGVFAGEDRGWGHG